MSRALSKSVSYRSLKSWSCCGVSSKDGVIVTSNGFPTAASSDTSTEMDDGRKHGTYGRPIRSPAPRKSAPHGSTIQGPL